MKEKEIYIILVDPGLSPAQHFEPSRQNKDGSLTMALISITGYSSKKEAREAIKRDKKRIRKEKKRGGIYSLVYREYKIRRVVIL